MSQVAKQSIINRKPMSFPLLIASFSMVTLLIATGSFFAGMNGQTQASTVTPAATNVSTNQCTNIASPQWSPVGVTWKLTVSFLTGSRQGTSELSFMTFLSNGSVTATFPGDTAGTPDILPPAIDGWWCWTGQNAFHYQFRDVLAQQNQTILAYVQTAIDADLTSATTYVAGGIGIAYDAATGTPIKDQYNTTETKALAWST